MSLPRDQCHIRNRHNSHSRNAHSPRRVQTSETRPVPAGPPAIPAPASRQVSMPLLGELAHPKGKLPGSQREFVAVGTEIHPRFEIRHPDRVNLARRQKIPDRRNIGIFDLQVRLSRKHLSCKRSSNIRNTRPFWLKIPPLDIS